MIGKVSTRILQLRDFARSYSKTSDRLVNRGFWIIQKYTWYDLEGKLSPTGSFTCPWPLARGLYETLLPHTGKAQGQDSISRCRLTSIENPIVEIRRSLDRLISTMGFPILVRWHLYIESRPRWLNPSQYKIRQTYRGPDKMAIILETTFFNTFLRNENVWFSTRNWRNINPKGINWH